jgi:NAD(P)-dependent dehydrogenase (short-subunit alcohol dehydrogenase family)
MSCRRSCRCLRWLLGDPIRPRRETNASAALPHMKAPCSGHIINVSSIAGHVVNHRVRCAGLIAAGQRWPRRDTGHGPPPRNSGATWFWWICLLSEREWLWSSTTSNSEAGPRYQLPAYRQGDGECLPVARETGVRQQNLSRWLAKARSRRVRSRWEMTHASEGGVRRVLKDVSRPWRPIGVRVLYGSRPQKRASL